jgi:hypothetical protein
MAPITPWLATLIEAELENVIAWKRTVKPDLDTSHEHVSRFSDDGSNFRSSVGPPLLNAESTIQLLEVSIWTKELFFTLCTANNISETRLKRSSQDSSF